MLARTLRRLLQVPKLESLVVALGSHDGHWADIDASLRAQVIRVDGGVERADSVLAGLRLLAETADPEDLVLVHDAARPCIRVADIERLIATVQQSPANGGLLASPVRDTMKRSDDSGVVLSTESRDNLWHALTPQLFQLGILKDAIEKASFTGANITDESSAMEWAGFQPKLVQGSDDNIKVTRPDDIQLAEQLLKSQSSNR